MTARTVAALAALVSGLLGPAAAAAPTPAAGPGVDVSAVTVSSGQVSLVAALRPLPLTPLAPEQVTATAGTTPLPVTLTPVVSDQEAVGLVLDASSEGADDLQGGGLSGAAGFLLQVPSAAHVAVVADRDPPAVAAAGPGGVAGGLRAASELRSGGTRATSAALSLALSRLPSSPAARRVLVLFTGAADAGGETAAALTERLRRAQVILTVVETGSASGYWSTVTAATGGLAVGTLPGRAITAFDTVADALRARYVVSFPRPVDGATPVGLRFATSAGPFTASVDVPSGPAGPAVERATGRPSGATPPGDDPGLSWWTQAGILAAAALTIVVALVLRRRSTAGAAAAADPGTAAPPPLPPAQPSPPPDREDVVATPPIPEPVPPSDARTDTPAEHGPEPDAGTGTDADTGTDTDADTEIHTEIGTGADPETALRVRSAAVEQQLRARPDDPSLLRSQADTYARLADLDLAEGRVSLAEVGYRRGLDILERLADQEPHQLLDRAAVAAAHVRLADLDADAGWILQARARYRLAVEIDESLLADAPDDARFRQRLEQDRERLERLESIARRGDDPDDPPD